MRTGIGILLLLLSFAAAAEGLLVPAYFYPGTEWNRLFDAATQVPLIAIVNPDSGPGSSADPNYTDALTSLRFAGGKAVGYVHTSYGTRAASAVKAEIDSWFSFYPSIDGIFIDEMANASAKLAYYQDLYAYVQGKKPGAVVIGNPGTASDSDTGYLGPVMPAADVLVIHEDTAANYVGATPPDWVKNYDASRFAAIVHSQASADGMSADVARARARREALVFVTDDIEPNPYDRLPAYWNGEVAAVRGDPSGSTGGGAFSAAPLLLLASLVRRRRR